MENLEINDDPLELEGGDEAEDLTKKLLDEQGKKLLPKFSIFDYFLYAKLVPVYIICDNFICLYN